MNACWILLACMWAIVGAGTAIATEPPNDSLTMERGGSSPRSLTAIGLDVRAALRAEALSRRQRPNATEVVRLVELYRELAAHPKRDESAVVREMGLKLRSRLGDVREHVERRSGDSDRLAKQTVAPALVVPKTQVLAQQVAVPGGAAAGPVAAAAQVGPARAVDYGPQLVDLIQRTISPATWDINGGLGSVVYFAPRQVLVISAPESVHGQIGGVVGQLRAGQ